MLMRGCATYGAIPIADPDTHDEEPSEDLLDLYYYKMEQLQEITHRIYNSDDVKRLSSKLAKEQRGQIGVRIFGVKRMIFNCLVPTDLSGECLLNTFFGFQCKIDKIIMFYAIAKFVANCSRGTPLKRQLRIYIASHKNK